MTYPHHHHGQDQLFNGSAFEIGQVLGRIEAQGQRSIEIQLSMIREMQSHPERIASAVARSQRGREPSRQRVSLASIIELLKALLPLLILAAAAFGRVNPKLAAQLLGLAG